MEFSYEYVNYYTNFLILCSQKWYEKSIEPRMQMIHHLADRMKQFHALGYVHRDLKPANVMWLPRENRWTVIDFGCAARTGERSRLVFSLGYAAPEVISAYRAGESTIVAEVRYPNNFSLGESWKSALLFTS